jgi:transcriptional regulator with XRE-family HTH domain
MSSWALLREARSRSGLTQRALADRSGVAQSEIARIESGKQEPGFERLRHLVRSAGFDLRVDLVPRRDHDAELIREMLRASPGERLDSLEEQSEFFGSAREVRRGARHG